MILPDPQPLLVMPVPSRWEHADRARLVISCRDGPGIIAAVSRFLADRGANIVHSDQHTTDPDGGGFFLRMVFDLPGARDRIGSLRAEFAGIASAFGIEARWALEGETRRIAIFVSTEDHCLRELLWHIQAGDLRAEVAMVVSNHPEMRQAVQHVVVADDHRHVGPQIPGLDVPEQLA